MEFKFAFLEENSSLNEMEKLPLPILMISVDYGLAEIDPKCTIYFKHLILKPVMVYFRLWTLPDFRPHRVWAVSLFPRSFKLLLLM